MSVLAALSLALAAQEPTQAQPPVRVVSYDPGFELAGHRLDDSDADGRAELIVVARDGRVKTWRPSRADGEPAARGELVLPQPARTLLDVARFGGLAYLVAETPAGTLAYPIGSDGTVAASGATWIARGRFTLRVEAPTFSSIVADVNSDGVSDVIVPTLAGCELWLGAFEAGASAPTFRKAATVAVEIARWGSHDARDLSDTLEGSFAIPGLDTRDVDGDGRPDLIVTQSQRRGFHLQRADGSFPLQPDVAVDLSIFRDTTEAAPLQLGGTLSGGDKASYSSRDLDGDGIPDYVVGHRRKVWVFRGTREGPQFTTPSAILKTAEDITALVVIALDDDELPDLLLVKVQIPTLATLLRGLFGEWDVRIRALGYRNKGAASFETSPKWSNELVMRLPGIVGLIKNPEKILERFEELEKRFRRNAAGDVDGDGASDVLLVTESGAALEVWRGRPGEAGIDTSSEREVREIVFGEPGAVWNLERALAALGGFAERQVALRTGGRPADLALALRAASEAELATLECADFDGDGRDEIVIGYRSAANRRAASFDVIELTGGK